MIFKSALTEIHQILKFCPNPKRALSLSKAVVEFNTKLAKRTLRKKLVTKPTEEMFRNQRC